MTGETNARGKVGWDELSDDVKTGCLGYKAGAQAITPAMNGMVGYFAASTTSDKLTLDYDETFPEFFSIYIVNFWRERPFVWSGIRLVDFDTGKDVGSSGTKTLSYPCVYWFYKPSSSVAFIKKL